MGRKPKDNSPNAIKQRQLAGEHIRKFRKEVCDMNREEFTGENEGFAGVKGVIYTTPQELGRWERGEIEVPDNVAEKLSEITGVIKEYWLGITECKTRIEYDDECDPLGLEEYRAELDKESERIARIKTVLNFCGFGFEDFRDAKYDFVDFSNDPELIAEVQGAFNALTPYKITHIDKAVLPEAVYLSEDDLTSLLLEISNCIGYSCYKKLNRNK